MKKSISTTEEKADNQDVIKKLNKHVSEGVRRVDSWLGATGGVAALFSPQAVAARGRLRDNCERAIIASVNMSTSGQRYEEILWRKVYYDPYSTAKKMRKANTWSVQEGAWLWAHLNDGFAFYHNLLQSYDSANRQIHIDADFLIEQLQDDASDVNDPSQSTFPSKESILRCFTCLGDLARYNLDLPNSLLGSQSYLLPVRYYHQFLRYNNDGALIHSNLATVYSSNHEPLMATLHYLRALTCDKSFEAADGNLKKMLEKSRVWLEHKSHSVNSNNKNNTTNNESSARFLHTCLYLVLCLISNNTTEEVAAHCQDVLYQLSNLLENYDDPESLDLSEGSSTTDPDDSDSNKLLLGLKNHSGVSRTPLQPFTLNPDSMTILCGVFIVCVQRLKKQGSSHTNMAEVFLVSVLLTLVNHVNGRLEQRISLIDPSALNKLLPPEEKNDIEKNKLQNKDGDEEKLDKCNNDKNSSKKIGKQSRRRRRKKSNSHQGSSDEDDMNHSSASDGEGSDASVTDDDDDDDVRDDMSQLYSSEDDDESDYDIKIESDQEWDGLTSWEHLQMIGQEGMLSSVLVICDWLRRTEHVMSACIKTADKLWTSLARLLNIISVDSNQVIQDQSSLIRKEVIELIKGYKENNLSGSSNNEVEKDSKNSFLTQLASNLKCTPLPEDLMLCSSIPSHLSNSSKALNIQGIEIVFLRLVRLDKFGVNVNGREDCPVWKENNRYIVAKERCVNVEVPHVDNPQNKKILPRSSASTSTNHNREADSSRNGELKPGIDNLDKSAPEGIKSNRRLEGMQSLTKQWLQHEVQSLEERTSRRATLGLYLVPDASVLINHLPVMKLLLAKPSHMIIIPQTVIDSLDHQKKDSIGARDAIRWLEVIFRHGSRFLRAQRAHEKTHLPLIKYPRRKDKEAWNWYQIMECCHYLGAQVQHSKGASKTSTVTLLTGENNQSLASQLSFSPTGLAQAAGAVLEHIDDFMQKWQTSTKGHS